MLTLSESSIHEHDYITRPCEDLFSKTHAQPLRSHGHCPQLMFSPSDQCCVSDLLTVTLVVMAELGCEESVGSRKFNVSKRKQVLIGHCMVTIERPLLARGSRKILSNKSIKVRLCYKSEVRGRKTATGPLRWFIVMVH